MTAKVRQGMPTPRLSKSAFRSRFFHQFYNPAFPRADLERTCELAWQIYQDAIKAPRTRQAGPEFADPGYKISVEWLAARDAVRAAEVKHRDATLPARILLINGSPRSEHTCPGEMSKTYRLLEAAREALVAIPETECEVLDLSRLASEYERHIYP